jgi:hypothetical protein
VGANVAPQAGVARNNVLANGDWRFTTSLAGRPAKKLENVKLISDRVGFQLEILRRRRTRLKQSNSEKDEDR